VSSETDGQLDPEEENMKTNRVSSLLAALALVVSVAPAAGTVASAASFASPLSTMGPQAIPAAVHGPSYGLFTCQLGLDPSGVICYDPYQMRHAYGIDNLVNAGLTGKGRTIIIVDAYQSPNIVDQLNTYDTFYGLPGLNGLGNPNDPNLGTFTQIAPDGLTPFDPTDSNMIGWAEEISLDVEWAHAIAPGANIVLDVAKTNDDADILSATKFAVDHNLGDIISQSFGENESCVDSTLLKAEHQLFAKATLKHITLFASSGDEGAAQPTCDGSSWVKAASSPASDPLVTAVGGTELRAADYCLTSLGCDPATNPAPGTWQGEIAWNEGAPFGDFQDVFGVGTLATGGGFSVLYKAPFFQRLATRGGKQRGVPDVAYSAAVLHGVLTYIDIPGLGDPGFWLFGGTSAGSPQWAAIAAIADQKAGRRLGFINAALYLYSLFPNLYSTLFHDVTSGSNSAVETLDAFGNPIAPVAVAGFNAGTGWDATTGLGSPKADNLVSFLTRFTSDADGNRAVQSTDPNPGGHFGHHLVGPH
jgi:subtilase family serine protease